MGTAPTFKRWCSLIRELCSHTHTHTHTSANPRDYKCQELLVQKLISDWGEGEPGVSSSTRVSAICSSFLPNWPPDSVSYTLGRYLDALGLSLMEERLTQIWKVCATTPTPTPPPTFSSSLFTSTRAGLAEVPARVPWSLIILTGSIPEQMATSVTVDFISGQDTALYV